MISLNRLEQEISRLEAKLLASSTTVPAKRPVPEWLQTTLESQGFVFNSGGQVISSPDRPARHKSDPQTCGKGAPARTSADASPP